MHTTADTPTRKLKGYQRTIAEILDEKNIDGIDPRHIEAIMRSKYGVLDWIPRDLFAQETDLAVDILRKEGNSMGERIARSRGL